MYIGEVYVLAYINSLLPLCFYLTPIKGRGGGVGTCVPYLCQWQWCSQDVSSEGQSEGAKRPRGWRVWEGPPSHGREIFEYSISCMKTAFSCTLNTIIRGSLCTGIDQFPILFFPFFCFNYLFIYLFIYLLLIFFFFFFTRRSTGGPWPTCAPLATPVVTCNWLHVSCILKFVNFC